MVSTLASGQVRQYVGDKDVFMLNSIVDISGLNRVSRLVLDEAARAMAGLSQFAADAGTSNERRLIAATMFGVTTPCVERHRQVLEAAGYEVLVFHATGSGGQAMESLVREGLVAGVLDITTTELADELVGGFLTAGPTRLTAAAQCGVPQVVSVGATDMVNFHAPESVPEKFGGRVFYRHNPTVTLMRTTPAENALIGADLGRKVAAATGPACILFPRGGVSAIDRSGQPFDEPAARQALLDAIRRHCGPVELVEYDGHINDPEFAEAAAQADGADRRASTGLRRTASRAPTDDSVVVVLVFDDGAVEPFRGALGGFVVGIALPATTLSPELVQMLAQAAQLTLDLAQIFLQPTVQIDSLPPCGRRYGRSTLGPLLGPLLGLGPRRGLNRKSRDNGRSEHALDRLAHTRRKLVQFVLFDRPGIAALVDFDLGRGAAGLGNDHAHVFGQRRLGIGAGAEHQPLAEKAHADRSAGRVLDPGHDLAIVAQHFDLPPRFIASRFDRAQARRQPCGGPFLFRARRSALQQCAWRA